MPPFPARVVVALTPFDRVRAGAAVDLVVAEAATERVTEVARVEDEPAREERAGTVAAATADRVHAAVAANLDRCRKDVEADVAVVVAVQRDSGRPSGDRVVAVGTQDRQVVGSVAETNGDLDLAERAGARLDRRAG